MKQLLQYIETKKLVLMLLLITIQQGMNAFATYALAKAGLSFQDKNQFIYWICLSLGLFLLAPVMTI